MHREETAAASAAAAHSTATSGSNAENRSGRDGEPKSAGAAAAAGTTAAKEMMDLDGEWRALDFTVHVSLRYHSKRRGFLENAHRWAMLLAVVSGSAAFVAVFGAETGLAKAATLIVVFATAIDVFFDLPVAAHRHDDLYKRFADVAVMLASAPAPTAEMLRECRARRLLIEKDEPHIIAVLNVLCHNEEAEARGYGKDQLWKVRPYQRILSQLFTAPPNDFDPPRVPV